MLSGAGGLFGVVLGIAVPLLVTWFAGHEDHHHLLVAAHCLLRSPALVGIVFGLYPAMRAAEMDPVEALRHE